MLKIRLNCPLCGILILVQSLEGHLKRVHKLTGNVTLRLNPTHPYAHKPDPEAKELEMAPPGEERQGGEAETDQETEPEAKAKGEQEPGEQEPGEQEPGED